MVDPWQTIYHIISHMRPINLRFLKYSTTTELDIFCGTTNIYGEDGLRNPDTNTQKAVIRCTKKQWSIGVPTEPITASGTSLMTRSNNTFPPIWVGCCTSYQLILVNLRAIQWLKRIEIDQFVFSQLVIRSNPHHIFYFELNFN